VELLRKRAPEGFWAWVNNHPDIPVFITEGLKKACALLTAGYVAIAIVGVGASTQERYSKLAEFAVQGRPVNLVLTPTSLLNRKFNKL